LVRYRFFFFDFGYDIERQYRDIPVSKVKTFDVVLDIGAISGYTDIKDSVDFGYDMPYLGRPGALTTFQPRRRVVTVGSPDFKLS
jgi:hypothetical protein